MTQCPVCQTQFENQTEAIQHLQKNHIDVINMCESIFDQIIPSWRILVAGRILAQLKKAQLLDVQIGTVTNENQ